MFKFIRTLLALAHLIALREEKKQAEKQKQFRIKAARLNIKLRKEAEAAHARGNALHSQAADAGAAAAMGSNAINEAERTAATLRSSLDYVVKK